MERLELRQLGGFGRAQSARFGTRIFSETVTKVDLSRRPFKVWTDDKEVTASTIILATGAAVLNGL